MPEEKFSRTQGNDFILFILFYFKIFIQVISFILNMFFKLTCLTKNKSAYTKKTREINLPNLNTIQ